MKRVFKVADRIRAKLGANTLPSPGMEPPPSEEELTDPESSMETIPAPPPTGATEEVGEEEEMRRIDQRINEIRNELMERLSDEDMWLFVEAVNLSAQLEELMGARS
tara:strand:- start:16 stop:336 length:321 start_codon:yes stop_codon:yes gene_type:complete